MTAVQLPEVPEPVAWAAPLAFQNFKVSGHLGGVYGREWMWAAPDDGFVGIYTAAQLREYATEAVRLHAIPGVLREQMEMLRDDFQRYSNGDKAVPFVVLREALVAALNAWDDYTNPTGAQQ